MYQFRALNISTFKGMQFILSVVPELSVKWHAYYFLENTNYIIDYDTVAILADLNCGDHFQKGHIFKAVCW